MIRVVYSRWNNLRGLCRWQLARHFFSHHSIEFSKTESSHPLLGPPEIYHPDPAATLSKNQWLFGLSEGQSSICDTKLWPEPPLGFIKFGAGLFPSIGNPCLDFFIYVCPNKEPLHLEKFLEMSWNCDLLTTLKIICFWRGVRECGKPKRETFYRIVLWLHRNHPKTLAYNLKTFVEFGYLKDLLEILYRLVKGPEVLLMKIESEEEDENGVMMNSVGKTVEEKINMSRMRTKKGEKNMSINMRRKKETLMAKEAVEKYYNDPSYQSLHNLTADIFAQLFKTDLELLKRGGSSENKFSLPEWYLSLNNSFFSLTTRGGDKNKISLAAKWCPSLDSSYDRSTLICESIARRVFPRDSDPEYKEIEEAHYAYRVRDRLRKQVVVPLRNALRIPESFHKGSHDTQHWIGCLVILCRIGYVARLGLMPTDKFRFWTGRVFLFPHNLVSLYYYDLGLSIDDQKLVERQWSKIVERLVKKGKFGSCLAVCCINTAGPLQSDIIASLSLLVSDLTDEPWKEYVVRYDNHGKAELFNYGIDAPRPGYFDVLDEDRLLCRLTGLKNFQVYGKPSSKTIDFQKIVDSILQFALDKKLSQDKMIKRLIVFCDLGAGDDFGFDNIVRGDGGWVREHQSMRNKFEEKGYILPELVFWNVTGVQRYPMLSMVKDGVTVMNGVSKVLITYFLEEGGRMRPEAMMRWAISGKKYKDLVVLD